MNIIALKKWFPVVWVLLLGACGAIHDRGSSSDGNGGALFVSRIQPILKKNCFSCHSQPNHPAGSRFYMHPTDNQKLFDEVFLRVKAGDAQTSLLLMRGMGVQHSVGNQLPDISEQEEIRRWIQSPDVVRGPGSGGNGSVGDPMASLKVTISRPAIIGFVRFSLDELGHLGAFVEVGVRSFSDGIYEFYEWRVHSPNYPLRISGIFVFVLNGGQKNSSNSLASVVLNASRSQASGANVTPLAGTPLSSRSAVVAQIGVGDLIQLGFTSLEILP